MSNSEADVVMSKTEINSMEDTEEEDADSSTKEPTAKIEELLSMETLRESPLQWPERFPGMEEFLTTSETPIHTPVVDPAQILANDNMKAINQFARLPPEQLIEKIKSMHDQIYKLGIRESKEMTRGKLLGIFGARERQTTKDVPPMRHS